MKKRLMRLLPVLIALVMVFGSSLTVFAAEESEPLASAYDYPYWVVHTVNDIEYSLGSNYPFYYSSGFISDDYKTYFLTQPKNDIFVYIGGEYSHTDRVIYEVYSDTTLYSSHDIKYLDQDKVFFQRLLPPSILVQVVDQKEMNKVLDQVIVILPICLVCLVGYLALRKALAVLRSLLHQA